MRESSRFVCSQARRSRVHGLLAMLLCGAFGLAACAGMEAARESEQTALAAALAEMEHRAGTPEVELTWRCVRPTPGLLVLGGYVRNPVSAQPVRDFAAELVGVDAAGQTLSAGRGEWGELTIRTSEVIPFRIPLHEAGSEVRVDLYYRYDYHELDRMGFRLASAASPFVVGSRRGYVVRDACNPSLHRIR
ncbi:MAG: hypothetical protein WC713_13295 [Candidatus Methylomirabilota bacterium]